MIIKLIPMVIYKYDKFYDDILKNIVKRVYDNRLGSDIYGN